MTHAVSNHIDIYCERTGPEFWAEPINALTNLSFLVAAVFLGITARKFNCLNMHMFVLIALVAGIGLGSFLFHTKAVFWAMMSDIIPIMLFQIYFLYVYSRWVLSLGRAQAVILPAIFILLTAGVGFIPGDKLNGSLGYAPSLILLIVVGAYHLKKGYAGGRYFLAAACIFPMSLFFRTVDEMFCPAFSLGTHFMWHILNGLVLFLLVFSLIQYQKERIRI